MANTVNDTAVPETQVTVPAHTDRPSVRYAPDYAIKMTDVLRVPVNLNGNEQKAWQYQPSIPPAPGNKLCLVVRVMIVETPIVEGP